MTLLNEAKENSAWPKISFFSELFNKMNGKYNTNQ